MSENTLNAVRNTVANVIGDDLSSYSADQNLELDSINRITLIAELENEFDIVIEDGSFEPEVFNTLGTLTNFVDGMR